jgi:hypothetical protein
MAQTMVKIHQFITEQASLPEDHNTVTNDNHQNMSPPPFDKEKLSSMQTQVLQGRMQPSTTYIRNEMAKDRVPIGPVKRQVDEAWNDQRKKKKHEALKLTMRNNMRLTRLQICVRVVSTMVFHFPKRKLVL